MKTKGLYSKKNKKKKKEKRRSHPSPHSASKVVPGVVTSANDSVALDATEESQAGKDASNSFQVSYNFDIETVFQLSGNEWMITLDSPAYHSVFE